MEARRVAYSRLAYLGIHHQSHLAFHRPNYQSPEVAVEARRQSHPEEAEACPEVTKAFQYPLVARHPEKAQWELVEVTKAHPESEDPEVVHHRPARQIRLQCPESVEAQAEAHPESEDPEGHLDQEGQQARLRHPEVVHHHLEMAEPEESEAHRPENQEGEWKRRHRSAYRGIRLAAASLHHHHRHHRELLALPVRGLAGRNSGPDVRPEMACCWDGTALTLALRPEMVWWDGPLALSLVVHPELWVVALVYEVVLVCGAACYPVA